MRRASFFLLAGVCAYAAVVIPVAIHKGGDFTAELTQSERLLRGLAPFGAADPNVGVPWPPFSAVVLVPFALVARLSLPLAKALWTAGGVVALWYALHWSSRLGWRPALLALGDRLDQRAEAVAPMLEILELIERGAGRRQQHDHPLMPIAARQGLRLSNSAIKIAGKG